MQSYLWPIQSIALFLLLINYDAFCSLSLNSPDSHPPYTASYSVAEPSTVMVDMEGVFPNSRSAQAEEFSSCLSSCSHILPYNEQVRASTAPFVESPLVSPRHFLYEERATPRVNINPQDREPFSLQSQSSDERAPQHLQQMAAFSQSAESRSSLLGGGAAASRRVQRQPIDKEAAAIPDMSQHNPNDFVRGFKRGMISVADKASLMCKILGAGCGILLAIGVGDYMTGGSFLSDDVQGKISILSATGVAVFKTLSELLEKIKLRDECRLISYDSRDKFLTIREEQHPGVYYSLDEIKDYLRQNNGFVTLPRESSFLMRSFLFNVMCFFESVLGMCWAVTAGLSGVTTISGVSDKNLLDLKDSATYRTLTIVFTATTAIIVLLDKNRHQLKTNCENWIVNYEMLIRYFVLSEGLTASELSKNIRPVPSFLINAGLHNAMEEAANLSTRN
jgi:hypothetical protein